MCVKAHACMTRNNKRSDHFCWLCRTCWLIEHRCAWDDGSVSRLFIWRRNWGGWQFPSHSFDMWHDSEASSRCHIFNWLLRSSNQHPAINKNRISSPSFSSIFVTSIFSSLFATSKLAQRLSAFFLQCTWTIHHASHICTYTICF